MSGWILPRGSVIFASLVLGWVGFSRLAVGQTRENPQVHLAQGTSLLRSGDYRGARAEFETALKLNPNLVEGNVFLGITENQLGDYEAAVSAFHAALRLDPRSDAAHYNLALSLLRLQKDDEALRELDGAVRLNPKLESAQYNLGTLLAKNGRFRESIAHLEAARALQPNDLPVLIHLVNAYFQVGHSEIALRLAKEVIGSDSDGEISASLGILLLNEGYYKEAVSALEKSRTHLPGSEEVTINLARAYIGANDPAKAIELLGNLREQQPAWRVPEVLGLAYVATGQPELARISFHEAIRLEPAQAEPHYNLGKLLLESSDEVVQKSGSEQIEEAIRLAPQGTQYYITLGRWMLEKYQPRRAIELLKRGISNSPPSASLYVMLGLAEIQLNGASAAKSYVEKAIELDPQSGPAVHLLGDCYFKTGDYTKAAKYFEKATELSPQNGLYFFDVSEVLERLNKTAVAVPFAERAVQLRPQRGYYHYVLGKLYAKLGRNNEAVKELETCVRLDPEGDFSYYLLARTYMRMGNLDKAREWSRKLQDLKDAKARALGLAAPASGPPRPIESSIPP